MVQFTPHPGANSPVSVAKAPVRMWPKGYLTGVTSVLLSFWPPVPRYACLNKNACSIIQVLYFVCP